MALEKGLILLSAGKNVVRFAPPLIVTPSDVDEMADILGSVLCEF